MDDNTNSVLSMLQEQMREDAVVKEAGDLQVGDIVYYDMDRADGIIPHEGFESRQKYVVVAGAKSNTKEICVVLINSEHNYSSASDWQAEQYMIAKTDYPGILDYDSWIDCTDPKELKVSKIKAKKAEKIGKLNDRDLNSVMKHLKENDFVDAHTRKVYGIDKFTVK